MESRLRRSPSPKLSSVSAENCRPNKAVGEFRTQDLWFKVSSAGQSLKSDVGAAGPENVWNSFKDALDAFYRFSRPHTVKGTVLSIVSVSLLAIQKPSDFSLAFFTAVLEAVIATVCMNIYVVGFNQITDIEIDKVNKPYLPLASGEYSVGSAILIVSSFALTSFFISFIVGSSPLFLAQFIIFFFGTAYSINLPFLRWKRLPSVAAFSILACRAITIPIAFFLHIQMHVFKRPALLPRPVIFATASMSFFSLVIALFKDIPDIEGDKKHGIKSFSVWLGHKRIFWICIALLEMAYAIAMVVGISSNFIWSQVITVSGHVALGTIVWNNAKSTDLSSKCSVTSFYMFIWKLFYAEYLLIPLVR